MISFDISFSITIPFNRRGNESVERCSKLSVTCHWEKGIWQIWECLMNPPHLWSVCDERAIIPHSMGETVETTVTESRWTAPQPGVGVVSREPGLSELNHHTCVWGSQTLLFSLIQLHWTHLDLKEFFVLKIWSQPGLGMGILPTGWRSSIISFYWNFPSLFASKYLRSTAINHTFWARSCAN